MPKKKKKNQMLKHMWIQKKTMTTQHRDMRERYLQKNDSQLQSLKSGIQIQIMRKINLKIQMLKLPKIKEQIQS